MVETKIYDGQKWKFNNEEDYLKEAVVIIQRIDIFVPNKKAVHLTIENIKIEDNFIEVSHLPIDLDFFLDSLISMELIKEELDFEIKEYPSFIEGYSYWNEASGGIWKIPLIEAINNSVSLSNLE